MHARPAVPIAIEDHVERPDGDRRGQRHDHRQPELGELDFRNGAEPLVHQKPPMRWGSGAAAPDSRAGQFDGRGVLGVRRAPESEPRQTVESRRQRSSRFELEHSAVGNRTPYEPRSRSGGANPRVERDAQARAEIGPAAAFVAHQRDRLHRRRGRRAEFAQGPQSVGRGAAGGCPLPASDRRRCSDVIAACCRRRPRDALVPARRHRRPSPRQQGRRTSAAAASSCPRSRRPPPNTRRATPCRSSKR